MPNENKMQKFTDAVLADAQSEKQRLLEEIEAEKAQRLQKAEEEILNEVYNLIQREVAGIKNAAGKELSRRNMDIRKELLSRRNAFTMQVFDRVTDRIRQYCETPEYKEQLSGMIAGAVGELGEAGTRVLCRKEDAAFVKDILAEKGLTLEVSGDPHIRLGGLRFANEEKGLLIDDTFDAGYKEQLSLFEENSGLIIM